MNSNTAITALKGVGDKFAQALENLEIFSVEELLLKFPRKYLDYTQEITITKAAELEEFGGEGEEETKGAVRSIKATVVRVKNIFLRGRGGRSMQQAVLEDESGKITATWFNMPFTATNLIPGMEYAFAGKLKADKKGVLQLSSPTYERVIPGKQRLHTGRIVPVYSLSKGISPKLYRRLIKQALDNLDLFTISDSLDSFNSEGYQLLKEVLPELHFPSSFEHLELASSRMALSEILEIQLILLSRPKPSSNFRLSQQLAEVGFDKLMADYWRLWGFEPTSDQTKACEQIWTDMLAGQTYRLLQGDVGSGKTAVAGFAAHLSLLSGRSAMIMAPTGVLAQQHFNSFSKIYDISGQDSPVELVTAQTETGKTSLDIKPIKTPVKHKAKLFIGTQALLHRYQNLIPDLKQDLGLVVVDEEHRFGVKQREQISQIASASPHFLSLTATPIPRTLALSLFGDMQVSSIGAQRPGVLPKLTYIISEQKRASSISWVQEKISAGQLVYWICPLIDKEIEVEDTKVLIPGDEKATVTATAKALKAAMPGIKVAALHGKLPAERKNKILADFAAGKYQILVSTTVVEVGIDVPAANVMFIESGASFGLAQLHQLRGRVGRHGGQGYCFVFAGGNISPASKERLEKFASCQDGIELAEYDLKSRGPGEVYGTIQSGVPKLQFADITDLELIKLARKLAESMKR